MLDYIRIACAVPAVKVGDVKKNTEDICACLRDIDCPQGGDFLCATETYSFWREPSVWRWC